MWLDGEDVRGRPLRERKALLRDALAWEDPLRLNAYRNEAGEAMFEEACGKGWEGVIAKRADSVYTSSRSRDWLKFKCEAGRELVVGGYTAPRGSREEFGALLVGVYDADGALRYAGKVGTGFNRALLKALGARLRRLRRDDSPFLDAPRYRDATWVEPTLVAQVGFAEWTTAGRLRHRVSRGCATTRRRAQSSARLRERLTSTAPRVRAARAPTHFRMRSSEDGW